MKRVVKIFLINSKRELLLYLRDDKPDIPYPGYWDFIGGMVEERESDIKALKREIKEEIGISIKNIEKIYELRCKIDSQEITMPLFREYIDVSINKIKLKEGQKIRYFELEKLHNLKLFSPLKKFIYKNRYKIFS